MADAHRQTNGQRCRTFKITALGVTGGKYGEDELKSDYELYHNGMTSGDVSVDLQGATSSYLYSVNFINYLLHNSVFINSPGNPLHILGLTLMRHA